MQDELRRLEERLLDNGVRDDPAQVAALLDDDFVEFGSSGRAFDKWQIIEAIQGEPGIQRQVENFAASLLGPTVALVTYRLRRREPDGTVVYALRSSLWCRSPGGWRMRFHQGTPMPPASDGIGNVSGLSAPSAAPLPPTQVEVRSSPETTN